jgi:hypothetical protein
MAAKPYRPKMTAAEKKAYKKREFGAQGKTGGMGGKYGRKAENLTAKQLKASGGLAASKKRTVDIGQTKREGGFTLGPGGKPLTGTVKLANGTTAVYKGGKRVQKSVAAPARKPVRSVVSNNSKVRKPSAPTTRVSPKARGEGGIAKPKGASDRAGGTFTKSYERKGMMQGGVEINTLRDRKVYEQRLRERARIAARKKAGK